MHNFVCSLMHIIMHLIKDKKKFSSYFFILSIYLKYIKELSINLFGKIDALFEDLLLFQRWIMLLVITLHAVIVSWIQYQLRQKSSPHAWNTRQIKYASTNTTNTHTKTNKMQRYPITVSWHRSNGRVWAPFPGGRSPHHEACIRSSDVG